MKKQFLLFTILLITGFCYGQIEAGLLLGLTEATTTEINNLKGMAEGQMLYNTDTKEVMIYNGSQWISTSNSNWLSTGEYIGPNGLFGQ